MGVKLLWLGLTFILALRAFLTLLGISGGEILEVVGSAIMVIGLILYLLDR